VSENQRRDELMLEVESAADWRSRKAAVYPDDARNARSAAALRQAARDLAQLPEDDPRLLRMDSFFKTVDDDGVGRFVEESERIIGRHGFDSDDATTANLLASLLEVIQRAEVDSLDRQTEE